jgi:hypothetical protein
MKYSPEYSSSFIASKFYLSNNHYLLIMNSSSSRLFHAIPHALEKQHFYSSFRRQLLSRHSTTIFISVRRNFASTALSAPERDAAIQRLQKKAAGGSDSPPRMMQWEQVRMHRTFFVKKGGYLY